MAVVALSTVCDVDMVVLEFDHFLVLVGCKRFYSTTGKVYYILFHDLSVYSRRGDFCANIQMNPAHTAQWRERWASEPTGW